MGVAHSRIGAQQRPGRRAPLLVCDTSASWILDRGVGHVVADKARSQRPPSS
jgi:hypothetical protein